MKTIRLRYFVKYNVYCNQYKLEFLFQLIGNQIQLGLIEILLVQ